MFLCKTLIEKQAHPSRFAKDGLSAPFVPDCLTSSLTKSLAFLDASVSPWQAFCLLLIFSASRR
jgi:hypothetical protein